MGISRTYKEILEMSVIAEKLPIRLQEHEEQVRTAVTQCGIDIHRSL